MKGPILLVLPVMMIGCGGSGGSDTSDTGPIDIATLDRVSEVFLTADGEPYSGPAFSVFETDPSKIREEGTLKDGEWDGLYESHYFNGQLDSRIRYSETEYHGAFERYYANGDMIAKGMYEMGARCGDWIDVGGNDEVYPPCP